MIKYITPCIKSKYFLMKLNHNSSPERIINSCPAIMLVSWRIASKGNAHKICGAKKGDIFNGNA